MFPIHTPGPPCSCGKPCHSPGKHPITRHGVKDATVDPGQINAWARQYPGCNWAIACGPPGPMVLDVDPRNGGDESLDELTARFGALPETLAVQTGGGGAHYYLALAEGMTGAASKLGPGLDWQGVGKYVVAPPSLHASGAHYRWASPRGTLLATVPRWLAELAERPPLPVEVPAIPRDVGDREKRARAYLTTMPPSVAGQGGHDALWRAAVALVRGFGLDDGTAFALLWGEFNPRCSPVWSQREVRHKVVQAGRAKVPAGYLLGRR